MNELTFPCMGTTVRLLADAPLEPLRAGIETAIAARLARYDAGSELSALNADPREEVPVSTLLRRAVQAALLGARRTGGLATRRCSTRSRRAGYARSRSAPARAARRRPRAAPGGARRRRAGARAAIDVTDADDRAAARAAARPRRLRKGHVADWVAALLARPRRRRLRRRRPCRRHPRRALSRHGRHARASPTAPCHVRHRAPRLARPDGRSAHHLLDPATGEPAWTGVSPRPRSPRRRSRPRRSRRRALLAGAERARRAYADGAW